MQDVDDDDYGDATPSGPAVPGSDCDDANDLANPGQDELCADGADNDCDTLTDLDDPQCSDLSVANLEFTSGSELSWTSATAATSYGLYRGTIPDGGFGGYNHLCEASEISGTSATDVDEPREGEGFYYIATGQTVDTGPGQTFVPGPLGQDSAGTPRPDSSTITCGPRVYVDSDSLLPFGDGLSWATAYSTARAALRHLQAPERGLEVWMSGAVVEQAAIVLDGTTRPGARLLGGFDAAETAPWQRNPQSQVTTWSGIGSAPLIEVNLANVVLDGLTMNTATDGLVASGSYFEFVDLTMTGFSGWGLDLVTQGDSHLIFDGNTVDASGAGAVRGRAQAGRLDGRISNNDFAGGSDAAVWLEAQALLSDATVALDVVQNRISGGAIGLRLGAAVTDVPFSAIQSSFVGSNLVYDTTDSAVVVEAIGDFSTETGAASASAAPLVVGNTISDSGAAGLVCSAVRSDGTGNPAVHQVRATPGVYDNLITFNATDGVAESSDDVATNLVADPTLRGNDLFGNPTLYRDEGVTPLTDIASVNALAESQDNLDADPLYIDRFSADYHLQLGTQVVAEFGRTMRFRGNTSDPGLGLTWIQPGFNDFGWLSGTYGVGYDNEGINPLLLTNVVTASRSVFTRLTFDIEDTTQVRNLLFGCDYDDGCMAWINGVEVFRSATMPAGDPAWDTLATSHESSNGPTPVYEQTDVSGAGIPALVQGSNVLAVGVWNASAVSADLILVPQLIINNNDDNPALDAGHSSTPRRSRRDVDGQKRIRDGNGNGQSRADLGADER